jgi:hypothetical protein
VQITCNKAAAYFVLPGYKDYALVFLALSAIPANVGDITFSICLLLKGAREI